MQRDGAFRLALYGSARWRKGEAVERFLRTHRRLHLRTCLLTSLA
ncbi:MAG TPA: hypothetical protein VKZ53_30295 [Candidatus Angelobacter sp.]|jgi:hypothetical protein|nr:hypothetical protein [Candidatus Angelobacter sp.]